MFLHVHTFSATADADVHKINSKISVYVKNYMNQGFLGISSIHSKETATNWAKLVKEQFISEQRILKERWTSSA